MQIDKNIPIPDRGRYQKLPLKTMEVGDSFVVERVGTSLGASGRY